MVGHWLTATRPLTDAAQVKCRSRAVFDLPSARRGALESSARLVRLKLSFVACPRSRANAGLGFTKLAIALLPLATSACTSPPDLTTRQGRFMNLVRVLAESGRLDDPEEVGRLLGTRFASRPDWPQTSKGEHSCEGEKRLRDVTRHHFQTTEPFWYAAGQPPALGLTYWISRTIDCDGKPIADVGLRLDEIRDRFCLREADVDKDMPGLTLSPLPPHPTRTWHAAARVSRNEATGVVADFGWPMLLNPPRRAECVAEVSITQNEFHGRRERRQRAALGFPSLLD